MYDFHSHVLPGLDDGSRDVKMTLKMLNISYNQGVTKILASPHFVAEELDYTVAIRAREASYRDVMSEVSRLQLKVPEIILGFEVLITKALLSFKDLRKLCINGTNIMLVELPFCEWNEITFKIIEYLADDCGIIPIIAHVERYINKVTPKCYNRLMDKGYYAQVNANSFINKHVVDKIDEFIISGQVHVIGSDAHNLLRCSLMDVAYKHIRDKLGDKYIQYLGDNGNLLMPGGLKSRI